MSPHLPLLDKAPALPEHLVRGLDRDDRKYQEVRTTVMKIKQSDVRRRNQGTTLREVVRKDFFEEVIHKPRHA